MNLLNQKYVFQKRKHRNQKEYRTAGSIIQFARGSLAKRAPERVSAVSGHWIQSGRSRLDLEGASGVLTGEEGGGGGRHERRRPSSPELAVWANQCTKTHGTGTIRQRRARRAHPARRWRQRWRVVGRRLATAEPDDLHTVTTWDKPN